jgi:hypothetical protein
MIKYLAFVALIISSTTILFAGPKSTPNATVVGSTAAATSISVANAVAIANSLSSRIDLALNISPNTPSIVLSSLSTILNVNGNAVEVSLDATGARFIEGQPLVVNGIPNLGLLMRLGYN